MGTKSTTLSLERYAPDAKALVAGAQTLADERSHVEVEPLHLLARALDRDPGVVEVFRDAGANVIALKSSVERALDEIGTGRERSYLSSSMLDLLERAERESVRERSGQVQMEHLLNALSQEIRGPAGEILGSFGVSPGSLRGHLAALRRVLRPPAGAATRDSWVAGDATRDLVQEARSGALEAPIGRGSDLRRLLTVLERRQKSHPLLVGEPGVGKGAMVAALAHRIARGDVPTNLADARLLELELGSIVAGARLRGEIEERLRQLLAQLGQGKLESILVVRGLEQLFGQNPTGGVGELLRPALARVEFRLLGTTTPEGRRRLQERDAAVLRLFTEIGVEEPSVHDATEILRGVASRYERHHKVRISDPAIVASVHLAKRYLQDRFLPDSALDLLDESAAAKRVEVDGTPARIDEVLRRIDSLKAQLVSLERAEDAQSVEVRTALQKELEAVEPEAKRMRDELDRRRGAVAAARSLREELEQARQARERARVASQYAKLGELDAVTIPDLEQRLEKAEAAARQAGVGESEAMLGEQDIAATLATNTGIPVSRMLEGEADRLLHMDQRLGERVVGQDAAVQAVARAVRRGRVGLRDPRKPIGSFLFLGPSGVGKTELAKVLAELLFDDEQALTRLDMSEYMERHMAQRLLGAPPGYADSEQGGLLTEAVRQRPYSVLLFDEVEKAHQDVFNLLLQVLDDGRLTDGRGRQADFTNTVVMMTSNIGSGRILETDPKLFESAEGREALRDVLLDDLRAFFRPEFLNRIDEIVVFRPLSKDHLRRIVDLELRRLSAMLDERKLVLEVDDAAKARVAELGYEPALGARPLKRVVLRLIQDPLAEAIVQGKFPRGSTVRVSLDGAGEIVLGAASEASVAT
jgi:ATP-dependent Clp protease ATP-binding subunit ClpB